MYQQDLAVTGRREGLSNKIRSGFNPRFLQTEMNDYRSICYHSGKQINVVCKSFSAIHKHVIY